jgi:hypothetical protein
MEMPPSEDFFVGFRFFYIPFLPKTAELEKLGTSFEKVLHPNLFYVIISSLSPDDKFWKKKNRGYCND